MSPKDYRWYVQNAIEQCDHLLRSNSVDYSRLMNKIIKIKGIGLEYENEMIQD